MNIEKGFIVRAHQNESTVYKNDNLKKSDNTGDWELVSPVGR